MKRIISIILAAILLFCFCAPAFAAPASDDLKVSASEITLADTVTISYLLVGNTSNIGEASLALFFDNEAFDVVSLSSDYFTTTTRGSIDYSDDEALKNIRITATSNKTFKDSDAPIANGAVVKVTFKPTGKAAVGSTYDFSVGSAGRTYLLVNNDKGEAGSVIDGPKTNSGEAVIVHTVKVTIIQSFTVRYTDGVGGKAFKDQTTKVKEGASTPAFSGTPKFSGYTFKGWNQTIAKTVTKDVVYTAVWEKNPDTTKRFTITYSDGLDGTLFDDVTYTIKEGEKVPEFEGTVEREGYVFEGWSPDPQTANVTSDIVFLPIWREIEKFTVTYTDGVAEDELFADKIFVVEYGEPTPQFGDLPVRPGYTFEGWNPEISENVTNNVVYTAKWVEKVPQYYIDTILLNDEDKDEDRGIEIKSPSGGDTVVAEYRIMIGDDGYTKLYIDVDGNRLPADLDIKIVCEDNGKLIYQGPLDNVPSSVLTGLSGKAGEIVHITVTGTLDPAAGEKYAGMDGNLKVSFKIGEKDSCNCFLCRIFHKLGGTYCICPWCWIILILILIIIALAVVVCVELKRIRDYRTELEKEEEGEE